MADDDAQDPSQRTEDPTHKRLDEAVKRGQVVFSREVTNFFMLLVLAFMVGMILPHVMVMTYEDVQRFITRPHDIPTDAGSLRRSFTGVFVDGLLVMAILIGGTWLAAIGGSLIQRPLVFSSEPIKPKLEKISLIKGFKRLFSLRSVVEFVKGLIKITVLGLIAAYAVWPYVGYLNQLPGYESVEFMRFIDEIALRMVVGVCIAMAFIAALDYLYQRYEYIKGLRMSRQEIRDEYKEQEGDPHIKGKIRAIRQERARKRMMAAVPQSDVVITNPTHFSVALQYDAATMKAPMVSAKGQDNLALKIREIAKEHEIPIVENKPLARALFDNVEIEQEIPLEYYQAVAEVISYVYKLKGKQVNK